MFRLVRFLVILVEQRFSDSVINSSLESELLMQMACCLKISRVVHFSYFAKCYTEMSEEKMLVASENAPVGDSHSNLSIWGNGSREGTAIASVQVLVIADDFSSHCL